MSNDKGGGLDAILTGFGEKIDAEVDARISDLTSRRKRLGRLTGEEVNVLLKELDLSFLKV